MYNLAVGTLGSPEDKFLNVCSFRMVSIKRNIMTTNDHSYVGVCLSRPYILVIYLGKNKKITEMCYLPLRCIVTTLNEVHVENLDDKIMMSEIERIKKLKMWACF